jgi:ABC-type nitrate/sulfonate/bicarbonate transport system, permease component
MTERIATTETRRAVPLPPAAWGAIGFLLLIALWTVASWLVPGRALPSPLLIAQTMVEDGWDFYAANFSATLARVAPGYFWGNAIAFAIAAIVLLVPALTQVANQFGVIVDCLPITAIGPLVMIMFGGQSAAIFLSGMVVFYTSLVTALLGVHAARRSSLELVTAYGGGKFMRLRKVQLTAALPAVFTALKIAVPGAIIGALVGEYLGGIDVGIGVALQAAQRDILPARTFGLSIALGTLSIAGYALIGFIGRRITPWAVETSGGMR